MVFVESSKKFAQKFYRKTTKTTGMISNLATDVLVTPVRPFNQFQTNFLSPYSSSSSSVYLVKRFLRSKKSSPSNKTILENIPFLKRKGRKKKEKKRTSNDGRDNARFSLNREEEHQREEVSSYLDEISNGKRERIVRAAPGSPPVEPLISPLV